MEPETVFYLLPQNRIAEEIVEDAANHERRCVDPRHPSRQSLRIGLDKQSKVPPYLAKFGRIPSNNDVILGKSWSKNDQCYFDFHPNTGELLLHDISSNGNTELQDDEGNKQIWKSPRQCVVSRSKEWNFQIGRALFRLIPGELDSSASERLAFVQQPVPTELEGTYEKTIKRLTTMNLGSETPTITRNLRLMHPNQLKPSEEIRHACVGSLGEGSQGNVDKVVDLYNGEHYARKVIAFKMMAQLESSSKKKILAEVKMVQKLNHPHIVPYLYTQGWEIGRDIEIFMPVYDRNLLEVINDGITQSTADNMAIQILKALDYIHTRNPQIIHRDVKPSNILIKGDDQFILGDFGIAEAVGEPQTRAGTGTYMAPELWTQGPQTSKVDIYALGVTYTECFEKFPPQSERAVTSENWKEWRGFVQKLASKHDVKSLLADNADDRPTAREILNGLLRSSQDELTPLGNLMDWMRTESGSTTPLQKDVRPIPENESREVSEPIQEVTQPLGVPPNPPAQPGNTRRTSERLANKRQKRSHEPRARHTVYEGNRRGIVKQKGTIRERNRGGNVRRGGAPRTGGHT